MMLKKPYKKLGFSLFLYGVVQVCQAGVVTISEGSLLQAQSIENITLPAFPPNAHEQIFSTGFVASASNNLQLGSGGSLSIPSCIFIGEATPGYEAQVITVVLNTMVCNGKQYQINATATDLYGGSFEASVEEPNGNALSNNLYQPSIFTLKGNIPIDIIFNHSVVINT